MSLQIETIFVPKGTDTHEAARHDHARGMRNIGEGLYSKVYGSNGTPYVVKIFRASDRGYRAWIQTLFEVGDLGSLTKYVPQIHKAFLYRYPDDCYDRYCYNKPGTSGVDSMVVYLEPLKPLESYYNPKEEYSKKKKTAGNRFTEKMSKLLWEARTESLNWGKLRPIHRDLLSLLMIAWEKHDGMGFDVHTGNIMLRGKQFVITDPLSGGG